ncbi:MAG: hypothetical protein QOE70_3139 [Chthoniobacter sp.]|nr:hypothetical protein [Chthoniobacter sp.]
MIRAFLTRHLWPDLPQGKQSQLQIMGKKTTNTNITKAVPPATRAAKPLAKSKPTIVPAAEIAVVEKRKTFEPVAAKPAPVPAAREVAVAAKRKAAEPAPAKRIRKPAAPKAPAYTNEDLALRAYFIAEKRHAAGLPGDSHQDWIEAERQLALEHGKSKKAKLKTA